MKSNVSPAVLVSTIVAIFVVGGYFVWHSMSSTGGATGVVVKPSNPNDPKYHLDPKLGLSGGQ